MKLLVVIPFCASDLDQASRLLDWIEELGRLPDNKCVLLRDIKLDKGHADPLLKKAKVIFKEAKLISTPKSLPNEGWPLGPNWMFDTALNHVASNGMEPFLWLEPDAVPMRSSWLTELEDAYDRGGKPFMGHLVKPGRPDLPHVMMMGVAVYPGDKDHVTKLRRRLLQAIIAKQPWDVAIAKMVVPFATETTLIWNFHGELDKPPTFALKKTMGNPKHTLELSRIPKATALYHRCKDPSLITILRGDGGPTIPQLCMAFKHGVALKKNTPPPVLISAPLIVSSEKPTLYHCTERHPQSTPEDERRVLKAVRSWIRIYKTGAMVPCHIWHYPRNSNALGDKRGLPFLKDILIEGMTRAKHPNDIIVWTNDDAILHPLITQAIIDKMKTVNCCGSFRVNFESVEEKFHELPPADLANQGKHDLGRDLFAFRKSWLRQNWWDLPDFVVGEMEFDLVLATMVRRDAGIHTTKTNLGQMSPKTEIPKGYVIHEFHNRKWTSDQYKANPSKSYNRKLAVEFYAKNNFPSMIGGL
jgi:hypothetical protein